MPSVPQSTINRWIDLEKKADPAFEIAHVQGAQGRTVGIPLPAWERAGRRITLFYQDAVSGEVRRAPGVFAAAGGPAQIEEQLIEQMREAGTYVPPKYNLPLLMKLHCLGGLGVRRTAKEYVRFTKRTTSPSTVRRLLRDITAEAADPEGRAALARVLMDQAEGEEWLRKKMESPRPTPPKPNPRHPIRRIWLTIRDQGEHRPEGSPRRQAVEGPESTSDGTGSPSGS